MSQTEPEVVRPTDGTPSPVCGTNAASPPGQTEASARAELDFVGSELRRRFPNLRFEVEKNALQVQRGTLLARDPIRFGLLLGRSYPTSPIIEHQPCAWADELAAA